MKAARIIFFILFLLVINQVYGQNFEGFESGDLSNFAWETSGDADWFVTSDYAFEGNYSAQSGDIDNNQLTNLSITYNSTMDDQLSFYWKVSSESNYDYLQFYLNGDLIDEISGDIDWTQVTIDVSSGENTFTWKYDKDFSLSSNLDTGWIDSINFPQSEVFDNDLAVLSLNGPGNVNVGTTEIYEIAIKNTGTNSLNNFNIKLMKEGGDLITSSLIEDTLEPDNQQVYNLNWSIASDEQIGQIIIYGEVEHSEDENPANNISENLSVNIMPAGQSEITIGDGSELSYYMPINFYYKSSLSEVIYYPEELNSGGLINMIAYDNNFSTDLTQMPLNIWMGETGNEDLSSGWIPATDLTQVFAGNVDFPSGQNRIDITLDTEYQYQGGNLVLMIERPLDSQYYSSSDEFYTTPDTEFQNRTRYYNSDSNAADPNNPPDGNLSDRIPNTTIYMTIGGTGSVSGYVYDDDNNPLTNATVIQNDNNDSTSTSQDGFFQFNYVEVGNHSYTAYEYGYTPQTIETEVVEDETTEIIFNMLPLQTVEIYGQVVGSDFPEQGLGNASITFNGYQDYQTQTDNNGYFSIENIYANLSYEMIISHENYETYMQPIELGNENEDLGTIVLTEITIPPGNIQAVVDNEDSEVTLTWNMPGSGDSEFRYDDGNIVGSIGYGSLPENAVFGAVHRNNAIINEIHWYLSSQYDSHPTVDLYIFGLDVFGYPDSESLLLQLENIQNSDDEWNTHILDESIEAENGFLVGVSTPNRYTGIGLDDGEEEPWVFQSETQYSITDYTNPEESWMDIGNNGFQNNLAIRCYGINLGDIDEKYSKINQKRTGKSWEYFKIYRFPIEEQENQENWSLLIENITDTTYTDTEFGSLVTGTYQYAITSVHTNEVESVPAYSNTVEHEISNSDDDNIYSPKTVLLGNYPNPFNPITTISFIKKRNYPARIEIYNLKGQKIKKLAITEADIISSLKNDYAKYTINWNGESNHKKHAGSGLYFYKLVVNDKLISTQKMLLLK